MANGGWGQIEGWMAPLQWTLLWLVGGQGGKSAIGWTQPRVTITSKRSCRAHLTGDTLRLAGQEPSWTRMN